MNLITVDLTAKELKPIFEKYNFDEYPQVHHLIKNKEVLCWYLILEKPRLDKTSIYDYMLWIRELRKAFYPDCPHKVCRRKTPKAEHGFANLTIEEFLITYRKEIA